MYFVWFSILDRKTRSTKNERTLLDWHSKKLHQFYNNKAVLKGHFLAAIGDCFTKDCKNRLVIDGNVSKVSPFQKLNLNLCTQRKMLRSWSQMRSKPFLLTQQIEALNGTRIKKKHIPDLVHQ